MTLSDPLAVEGLARREPLFSLAEAARRHFPDGRITARSLRTEIGKGRLRATSIAGKLLVTDSDIQAMIEAARCAPAASRKAPASTSGTAPAANPSGSSETERARQAQAAALRTVQALTKRSKPTSPTSTRRRQARQHSTSS